MKKTLFFAAFTAIIFAASCTKELPLDNGWESEQTEELGELVTLTVRVPEVYTRVTDTSGEADVTSLQVFVFRGSKLEAVGYSPDSGEVEIKCYQGTKTFVAVANYEEISGISAVGDFEDVISDLTDNTIGKFVMFGISEDVEVSDSGPVTVQVKRLVARIGILKITNDTADMTCEGTVTLKSIYLINVVGDTPLYKVDDYSPNVWYNKMCNEGDVPELLASETLNVDIEPGKSYTIPHYFYCCPNPTKYDFKVYPWSARYTRLAVEAEIEEDTVYYSATFSDIESNNTYTVTELKIQSLGALSPDDGPRNDYGFSVEVGNWDGDYSQTVEA